MRQATAAAGSQRGAVMVLVGVSMVVLIGMLGLVLDLGHLYIRKTELQNAADAAALSGARYLDGTAAGIDAAELAAIGTAALNASDFDNTAVSIGPDNIAFGPSPDGPWSDSASAKASINVGSMSFIQVDTSGIAQGTRPTWFMAVVGSALASTTATGYAVAGHTVCSTLPMFGCVQTHDPVTGAPLPAPTAANDYNFVKGQAYWFAAQDGSTSTPLNQGNIGWLDPVPPGAPKLINGASEMGEVLCRGRGYCLPAGVYSSLTQAAFKPMADALNTRFDKYAGSLKKEAPELCPADTNVKEYVYDDNAAGAPKYWMATAPLAQSENEGLGLGVHWSAVRPGAAAAPATSGGYPASETPYAQTSGDFFKAPSKSPVPQAGRRILSLGLADNCGAVSGSGSPVHIVAYGQFLMQRTALDSGSKKGFFGEFLRVLPTTPVNAPDIRLYR